MILRNFTPNVCFAMTTTINKAQGQSLKMAWIDLRERSAAGLTILCFAKHTSDIIYKEVLNLLHFAFLQSFSVSTGFAKLLASDELLNAYMFLNGNVCGEKIE